MSTATHFTSTKNEAALRFTASYAAVTSITFSMVAGAPTPVYRLYQETLGLTPLSVEVPYSDSAVEYTFKKQGFEHKTMYIVPNLPSPLFATLRRVEAEQPVAADGAGGALGEKPASAGRHRSHSNKQDQSVPSRPVKEDEDGVLEPSIH